VDQRKGIEMRRRDSEKDEKQKRAHSVGSRGGRSRGGRTSSLRNVVIRSVIRRSFGEGPKSFGLKKQKGCNAIPNLSLSSSFVLSFRVIFLQRDERTQRRARRNTQERRQ
jgi:hypothetical protein